MPLKNIPSVVGTSQYLAFLAVIEDEARFEFSRFGIVLDLKFFEVVVN